MPRYSISLVQLFSQMGQFFSPCHCFLSPSLFSHLFMDVFGESTGANHSSTSHQLRKLENVTSVLCSSIGNNNWTFLMKYFWDKWDSPRKVLNTLPMALWVPNKCYFYCQSWQNYHPLSHQWLHQQWLFWDVFCHISIWWFWILVDTWVQLLETQWNLLLAFGCGFMLLFCLKNKNVQYV